MPTTQTETLSPTKAAILAAERAQTLSHYDRGQRDAVLRLYNLARQHLGTSGGNTSAALLLGLYNGRRFPFDLTALRGLDAANLEAAFVVMLMDATRTYVEVHELIGAILDLRTIGAQFEVWAFDLKLKGRCTKEGYLDAKKHLSAWASV